MHAHAGVRNVRSHTHAHMLAHMCAHRSHAHAHVYVQTHVRMHDTQNQSACSGLERRLLVIHALQYVAHM